MIFNSLEFFIFFLVVLAFYYSLKHRWQNYMLLIASYFFYGWWDWRFLILILFTTTTDYYCGLSIYNADNRDTKKQFLIASIIINLSLLGFFKYFNFFIDSFGAMVSELGFSPNLPSLRIILPVGISFYTFQSMTYSIDIYRGKLNPTRTFTNYALFVSFFPQLVAGPIERAERLLSQIENARHFRKDQFLNGSQLIFWGLFKKVFVADNLAVIVDSIYNDPNSSGFSYILAAWAFAFQIYGDFSGYTDIARGCAKCMGFELRANFHQPYFATNPSDFWHRWHISLSSWLRDYLYIPLGGNRKGRLRTYINLMLTMLLGGLWHGAAWNFVLWGGYNGLLLCTHRLIGATKIRPLPSLSWDRSLVKAFFMFQVTCFGWMIFRAQSMAQILTIFDRLMHTALPTEMEISILLKVMFFSSIPFTVMAFQALRRSSVGNSSFSSWASFLEGFGKSPALRGFAYGVLSYFLCLYGARAKSFIYFQF